MMPARIPAQRASELHCGGLQTVREKQERMPAPRASLEHLFSSLNVPVCLELSAQKRFKNDVMWRFIK